MKTKPLGVAVAVALLGASSSVYAQSGWTFTTIDNPAAITGAGGTFAQGINDPGQVVGYFYDSTGIHGFSKTGSSFTTLNYPDAPLTTFAEGINNKGDVVGSYNPDVAGTVVGKAGGFLYSGGVYTAINDPPATLWRRALTTKIISSDITTVTQSARLYSMVFYTAVANTSRWTIHRLT
jgi:uncharacterized membrane protein